MEWAILLFIGAILAVHWWEYKRTVEEYTFAQPATLDKHDEIRSVMTEKTPMAVEIGALPWRPEVADQSAWTVVTEDGAAIPAREWIKGADKGDIANHTELANEMGLVTGLGDLADSRAWWWLPGMYDAQVHILRVGEISGLSWIGAERRWVGCTHGAPLKLWLVHSRYRRYLKHNEGANPWTLTVAEAPWIGRVQFVEVLVKPGWCIGLPAHWGYAMQPAAEESSWWWSAEQHSALSWGLWRLSVHAAAVDDDEVLEESA